jgi:hypothetical protein
MLYPTVNDEHLFVSGDDGDVHIFSVINPWNPAHVGQYTPSNIPHELSSVGDYLYIAAEDVFEVANISNPASPYYEGSVFLGTSADYFLMVNDGQYSYLSTNQFGVGDPVIVSNWPPDAPAVTYTFTDWPYHGGYGLAELDGYLYLGSLFGVRIYDLY